MNKNRNRKKNKQTTKEKIENPITPLPIVNTPIKEKTTHIPENLTNDKKNKSISQRGLLWINIFMLLAFIIANYFIVKNANESRDLAKQNAQIELRAYIQVVEAKITQVEMDRFLGISITI